MKRTYYTESNVKYQDRNRPKKEPNILTNTHKTE